MYDVIIKQNLYCSLKLRDTEVINYIFIFIKNVKQTKIAIK